MNKPPREVIQEVNTFTTGWLREITFHDWGNADASQYYILGMNSMARRLDAPFAEWLSTVVDAMLDIEYGQARQ